MSQRPPFVCVDCGSRVSSSAFRATCPECGGSLSPDADTVSDTDW
ncbi:rubrerythrin-like domain-containing protein [Haloquadratum walsbyi]|nr:rubrerythrin-like domain-containing protein [Haloquadratum walsbyi]